MYSQFFYLGAFQHESSYPVFDPAKSISVKSSPCIHTNFPGNGLLYWSQAVRKSTSLLEVLKSLDNLTKVAEICILLEATIFLILCLRRHQVSMQAPRKGEVLAVHVVLVPGGCARRKRGTMTGVDQEK